MQIFVWTTHFNIRSLNIRTVQHSDVEHIDIIVQGNFQFSYDALQYEIYHHTKITRYTVPWCIIQTEMKNKFPTPGATHTLQYSVYTHKYNFAISVCTLYNPYTLQMGITCTRGL